MIKEINKNKNAKEKIKLYTSKRYGYPRQFYLKAIG